MQRAKVKSIVSIRALINSDLILSCLICFLFFAVVIMAFPLTFETSDDSTIMNALSGYTTGTPQRFWVAVSVALGTIVSTLYKLFPSLPCYTLFMLGVMFASTVAMVYVALVECRANLIPFVFRIICVAVFLCLFVLHSIVYLQFTTTAGFAAGASIVLCCFVHSKKGHNRVATIVAIICFFLLAIIFRRGIRQINMLFLLLVLVFRSIYYAKQYRQQIFLVIAILLISLPFPRIDDAMKNSNGWADFSKYNVQRVPFQDYPRPTYNQNPEVYSIAGWTNTEYLLAEARCYIFPEFNIESLTQINAAVAEHYNGEGLPIQLSRASALWSTVMSNMHNRINYVVLIGIWISSIAIAILNKWKTDSGELNFIFRRFESLHFIRNHRLLLTLGIIVFFHAVCVYLIIGGRFPDRIFRMLMLLFAPISFVNFVSMLKCDRALYLRMKTIELRDAIKEASDMTIISIIKDSIYNPQKVNKIINSICMILLMGSVLLTSHTIRSIDRQSIESINYSRDEARLSIENYINVHKDDLFLYDNSSLMYSSPFSVFGEQKMMNIVRYGAGRAFSPPWYERIQKMGRDTLMLMDFWDDDVYLISRSPSNALVEYLQRYDPHCYFRAVDELSSGVFVFKLENPVYSN